MPWTFPSSVHINLTHSFKGSRSSVVRMSRILLNQSPMDDIWVVFSVQSRTRQRSSPNQDCKGKWKWSIQLKEAHSSGGSVLASEPWAQRGFGKVIEGCLTLSGQIRFPSILILLRDQGSKSRAEVDFLRPTVIYLWFASLLACSGPCSYAPISSFSPATENSL